MTWKEKMVNRFADPQVLFLMFIIAVIGIWMEVKNPGMIFPGVTGSIALILFLLGIKIIPINLIGLMLIILAFVLFILELKFSSFGLFTLGGIISFFIGSTILFDSPLPGGGIPMSSIIAMLAVVLAFVFIVVRAVISAHSVKSVTGKEGLNGEDGYALSDFSGTGKIFVHGEIWNAEFDGELKKGDKVIVDEMHGMLLKIRKK
jgi:membrane-bound serine protease (ClpP class)